MSEPTDAGGRPGYDGDLVPPSMFTDGPRFVPGEVLVKLRPEATARITNGIPTGPLRAAAAMAPSTFGVSPVDDILTAAGAWSVSRVHPPPPIPVDPPPGAFAASAVDPVANVRASTFQVRIDAESDVEDVVGQLAGLDEVEDAEPNWIHETFAVPDDPDFPLQWGLARINAPAAWDRTTGSPSVVVAVLDSGVDLDHPELAGLLVPGRDFVDVPANFGRPDFHPEGDFTGVDANPQDENGHGTHVAGTIACATDNGTGVAGVTWNCRILPVRVMCRLVSNTDPNDVRGSGSVANISAGIRWAADNGARIINLSIGGPHSVVQRDAVAYAISKGVVVVAAMGNENTGTPSFPAALPGVIAVGALDSSDRRAAFSNFGPHIDVAAPGVGIRSTMWNDTFRDLNGTSMASPHVAGVAALLLSCNPDLTADRVGQILRDTARPLRDDPSDPVPNDQYGHGLIDAAAALKLACPPKPSVEIICRPGPSRPLVACLPERTTELICTPQKSRPVVTCPERSVLIVCPPETRPLGICGQLTKPIFVCARSVVVPCPIVTIDCPIQPAAGVAEGHQPQGLQEGASNDPYGMGYDPYAYDPYGYGPYGYDPYSTQGDDPSGAGGGA